MKSEITKVTQAVGALVVLAALVACDKGMQGDTSSPRVGNTVNNIDPVTLSGTIVDGPVIGGTLYVFAVGEVEEALANAEEADDRGSALADSNPVVSIARADEDGNTYTIELPDELAGDALYLVFDNAGALDEVFGDEPFNMESVIVIDATGGSHHANVTPHTSMIAMQVRAALDLSEADPAEIGGALEMANANVVWATGTDDMGDELIPEGTEVGSSTNLEMIEAAATYLGLTVRHAAAASGLEREEVLAALAADSSDGAVDGIVPSSTDFGEETAANAAIVFDMTFSGHMNIDLASGSCKTSAELLRRACAFDVMDDLLEGKALCQDTGEEAEYETCFVEIREEHEENIEECDDMLASRLSLCESLDDAVHEPAFGEDFADNFVDPRNIGAGIEPNPWFPLVSGNQWVYQGVSEDDEGEEVVETITVTVTDKVKLIDGILCLVVNDVVQEGGEIIEDTDDWIAQDLQGNVWYCGEIAQEFETFEADEPAEPELVDLEGSWKAGRDHGEPGVLIPAAPAIGQIFRQEVLFTEAEDVVEILSLEGSESSPAASCQGTCLVTKDFTPLEPDVEENKYYVSGLGLIVEVNEEEGERVELQSYTAGP